METCEIGNCENEVYATGYCRSHYWAVKSREYKKVRVSAADHERLKLLSTLLDKSMAELVRSAIQEKVDAAVEDYGLDGVTYLMAQSVWADQPERLAALDKLLEVYDG